MDKTRSHYYTPKSASSKKKNLFYLMPGLIDQSVTKYINRLLTLVQTIKVYLKQKLKNPHPKPAPLKHFIMCTYFK